MARKKQATNSEGTTPPTNGVEWNAEAGDAGLAVAEPVVSEGPAAPQPVTGRPAWIDGPPTPVGGYDSDAPVSAPTPEPHAHSHAMQAARDTHDAEMPADEERPKTWGDPYKQLFVSPHSGFEMGENRQFKQRVFKFAERPEQSVIETLKESGFTYRPAEKAWTIPANPDTRRLSEGLVQQFAGEKPGRAL